MNLMERRFLKNVWVLFKGYWNAEEKWKARGLLGVVMVLNFVAVYILVLLNQWYNTFYNALQEYRYVDFWPLIGQFGLLAFIHIAIAVYTIYLRQILQIKWRNWMTQRYLAKWLDEQTYYKMQLLGDKTDNPDQRISEDINQFVTLTLTLALGGLKQLAVLSAFVMILWQLSGVITVPVFGYEFTIYGYMVWISLLYALGGTYLAAKIGKPLIRLNYDQQRYEADFRFQMVRFRENSESVAFYRGETTENANFLLRFWQVFKNYQSLIKFEKRLTWFTASYGQLAIIFPMLLAAPRYFSGQMQLGGVMQTNSAFGRVQDALSFLVDSYSLIAQWTAVVKRLLGFIAHMETVEMIKPDTQINESALQHLNIAHVAVDLPAGQSLLSDLNLEIKAGEKLLVTGASGCGKSTLLRTLAGIWPFGEGSITFPAEQRRLFLPQRPYLPLGNLREVLFYPGKSAAISDQEIKAVLDKCLLSPLQEKLDTMDDWTRILSLGEQQRIAFARVLLTRPDWVFLDEATSALDEHTESVLYQLIIDDLPNTAIVSVGHRNTLLLYHQRKLHLTGAGGWQLTEL